MKKCNKCEQSKLEAEFYANKRMKDGLNTFCIACHKADNVARKAIKRADATFVEKEKEQAKEYRASKKDYLYALTKRWRASNTDHLRNYGVEYRAKNKALINFLCQKRKIDQQKRTPNWLSKDDFWMIQQAYELAEIRTKMFGFSWHVDHIIPLRGKKVSGLHTPTNLQVIPASVNASKNNKFEV